MRVKVELDFQSINSYHSLLQSTTMRFEVNLSILVMKMASVISTITLLQKIGILPRTTSCNVCSRQLGPYLTNSNYHYFEFSNCNVCPFSTGGGGEGGAKAIWAMPVSTDHFVKKGLPLPYLPLLSK